MILLTSRLLLKDASPVIVNLFPLILPLTVRLDNSPTLVRLDDVILLPNSVDVNTVLPAILTELTLISPVTSKLPEISTPLSIVTVLSNNILPLDSNFRS